MIRFRQKEFFNPMAIAEIANLGLMAAGTVQGSKANKIAEEQGAAQLAEQKRMNDAQLRLQKQEMKAQQQAQQKAQQNALKIAKAQAKASGGGGLFSQREFANAAMFRSIANVAKKTLNSGTAKKIMSGDFYKNASGFAKDVYRAGKQGGIGKKALGMAATGATMAGAGYLVDKAIQADAKKSGIPIDASTQGQQGEKKKSSTVKKVVVGTLGTGAALATGLALGKRGKLNVDTLKKVGKSVGNTLKEQVIKGPASATEIKAAKDKLASGLNSKGKPMNWLQKKTGEMKLNRMSRSHLNVGNLAFTGAFAAMPAISYINQKKQLQEQTGQGQVEEKEYAVPAAGSVLKGAGNLLKKGGQGLKNVARGGIEWFSWGAGRSGQKAAGKALGQQAAKSGNKWTKGVSNFLTSDKNKALKVAGGLALGTTVMAAPLTMGDKVVRKTAEAVDKNAFAYEKSQNKQVQ